MTKSKPFLSLVVPVYNEEKMIRPFLQEIQSHLADVTDDYEIIFAADPCTDQTMAEIIAARNQDSRIKLLIFSRRFGQPAAIIAGLTYSRGQIVIPIDCDLQDPPALIPKMVAPPRPRAATGSRRAGAAPPSCARRR